MNNFTLLPPSRFPYLPLLSYRYQNSKLELFDFSPAVNNATLFPTCNVTLSFLLTPVIEYSIAYVGCGKKKKAHEGSIFLKREIHIPSFINWIRMSAFSLGLTRAVLMNPENTSLIRTYDLLRWTIDQQHSWIPSMWWLLFYNLYYAEFEYILRHSPMYQLLNQTRV